MRWLFYLRFCGLGRDDDAVVVGCICFGIALHKFGRICGLGLLLQTGIGSLQDGRNGRGDSICGQKQRWVAGNADCALDTSCAEWSTR